MTDRNRRPSSGFRRRAGTSQTGAILLQMIRTAGYTSQAEFAESVGTSPAILSNVIAGKRTLNLDRVPEWSIALRLDQDAHQLLELLVNLDHSPPYIRCQPTVQSLLRGRADAAGYRL